MKILVIGGFASETEATAEEDAFAKALGKAVVERGHVLFNGCYNEFDNVIATAAAQAIEEGSLGDPKLMIESFLTGGQQPSHRFGRMRKLRIESWDPGQSGWEIPEPIKECDAVMLVGGGPGSLRGAHLASLANKPLLPVTAFGGAAEEVFAKELREFDSHYAGKLEKGAYTVLDEQFPESYEQLAQSITELASRMATGNSVFVIMAYRKEMDDTFNTIRRVVREFGYDCERMDKVADTERIFPRMIEGIKSAALVICDVSVESINVYYELGFAEALGKGPIVVAQKNSRLPFDINDIPTTFYEDQTRLEEQLRTRVQALSGRQSSSD